MENPATWGEAELIVRKIYTEWWDKKAEVATKKLHGEPVAPRMGLSLERRITDALREAGLLKD